MLNRVYGKTKRVRDVIVIIFIIKIKAAAYMYIEIKDKQGNSTKVSEPEFVAFLSRSFIKRPRIVKMAEKKGTTQNNTYFIFKIGETGYTIKCNRVQLKALLKSNLVESDEFKFSADGRLLQGSSAIETQIKVYYQRLEDRCLATNKKFKSDIIKVTEEGNVILVKARAIVDGLYVIPPFITEIKKVTRQLRDNLPGSEDFFLTRSEGIFPKNIKKLKVVNTSKKLTDISGIFADCSQLEYVDLSDFDFSGITNTSCMFRHCAKLKEIKGIKNWDVSRVTNMSHMFYECFKLKRLDIGNWNVSSVETMATMFYECNRLESLDIGNWDVSSVKTMQGMFYGCSGIERLDIGNWNVTGVENMGGLFFACCGLKSLEGIGNWDVSNVKKMWGMFRSCLKLERLDSICNWDVSSVEDMQSMFNFCRSLKSLGNLWRWNVSKVTDMEFMFHCCRQLYSIDIGSWDVSRVRRMTGMFWHCNKLAKLNIDNWNVTNVEKMESIFDDCENLKALPMWYRH